ncbi:MAG: phage portal protein [Oscillospiraceae bacterium]|nr:phage portal protein [Oscillospiraceae bacterium]
MLGTNWVDILKEELGLFLESDRRREMLIGERYYQGKHDILDRKKTIVGPGGRLEECKHLQNSRVVDNQYARIVDQKVSYLLGKPLKITTERKEFTEALLDLFGPDFQRKLRLVAEDALNAGIGWLHPCYDGHGKLRFRRIAPWELRPFWADDAKTELEGAMRVYQRERGGGMPADTVVEHFSPEGICCFVDCAGEFRMERGIRPYFSSAEGDGVWPAVPLIPFRAGFREIPLIRRVKGLQDGINLMLSDFQDRMGEDTHHTVLVIRNFDGEDLGEFRRNLATFGAVKVRGDGVDGGGVDTLSLEVNAGNFEAVLRLLKRGLVENAKGFDTREISFAGSPNQMAIQSMYADMDLDAGVMEIEFQAAFRELMGFVCAHFDRIEMPGLKPAEVEAIFYRDVLINEAESIENCVRSASILSRETILCQHPWTRDVEKEMQRLAGEATEQAARERQMPRLEGVPM